ncbi:pep-cterm sorting domain-containing protein [Anaeramoeba flamelloides]|uniref:Pep-cterm sorting domain-containing protein n=1 Tax=Anaeramoeba flamelloides TaxID=1746091 RepID=A0ABQ8YVC9_9EUKA|nr:pep-cterm sorting domain-containing protein [Anaeramoeba flamelloides]
MILSSEHKVYIAGSVNVQIKKFQLFDFFTDKDPIAISGSQTSILVLTSDEKLYCVPKFHSTTNLEGEITKVTNITSQRQQLQQLHLTLKLEQKISSIFFDYHTNILLCFGTDPLNIDFSLLYKSNQHFADQKIFDIPVHSSVLKMRLNYDLNDGFETIKNNIEKNFTKEETLKLLDWIYEEINIRNLETCEKIKSQFNIDNLLEKTIKQDLIHLYKNEESKDFSLLVKDYDEEDNDDEEGEEEEEEEENYEEIPVHKFILIARSGLFREMFKNISENVKNLNSIRDYSRKSVESIEILIKYFYTDKIELTADDDPALIVEELSDAVEYYQLNPNSTITHELNSIRKQFNLD